MNSAVLLGLDSAQVPLSDTGAVLHIVHQQSTCRLVLAQALFTPGNLVRRCRHAAGHSHRMRHLPTRTILLNTEAHARGSCTS